MPNKLKPASLASSQPHALHALRDLLHRGPQPKSPLIGSWLNRPKRDSLSAHDNPELPAVAHPPMFRPDIPSNNPDVGRALYELLQIAPDLKGRTPRVWTSPTRSVMEDAIDSSYPIERLPMSNLNGQMDIRNKEVWINPSLIRGAGWRGNPGDLEKTLAHELGHTAGYGHEPDLEDIELLARGVGESRRKSPR